MKLSAIKPKWIYLVGCFLIILTIGFFVYKSKIEIYNKQNQSPEVPVSDEGLGSEIIANLKTVKVLISSNKLDPEIIEIKPYDQVLFDNKTGLKIHFSGSFLKDIYINENENITQSFSEKGNFDYKITAGEATFTGKIIVK